PVGAVRRGGGEGRLQQVPQVARLEVVPAAQEFGRMPGVRVQGRGLRALAEESAADREVRHQRLRRGLQVQPQPYVRAPGARPAILVEAGALEGETGREVVGDGSADREGRAVVVPGSAEELTERGVRRCGRPYGEAPNHGDGGPEL